MRLFVDVTDLSTRYFLYFFRGERQRHSKGLLMRAFRRTAALIFNRTRVTPRSALSLPTMADKMSTYSPMNAKVLKVEPMVSTLTYPNTSS
jgi:hypothetical protein